jgi:hypothetical protein
MSVAGSCQAKCDSCCHDIFCMNDESGSFPRPIWTVAMVIVGIGLIIISALCFSGTISPLYNSQVELLLLAIALGAGLSILGCILTGVHINTHSKKRNYEALSA